MEMCVCADENEQLFRKSFINQKMLKCMIHETYSNEMIIRN